MLQDMRNRVKAFWAEILDRPLSDEEMARSHRAGIITQRFGLGFAPALFTFLEWVIVAALIDYARVRTHGFDHVLTVSFEVAIVVAIWFYFGSLFQELPPPTRTARETMRQTRLIRRAVIGIVFALAALFFGYRLAAVVGDIQFFGSAACPTVALAASQ